MASAVYSAYIDGSSESCPNPAEAKLTAVSGLIAQAFAEKAGLNDGRRSCFERLVYEITVRYITPPVQIAPIYPPAPTVPPCLLPH
ncbi:unnamed protein product, partial [Mesorhabditis spiculigera]